MNGGGAKAIVAIASPRATLSLIYPSPTPTIHKPKPSILTSPSLLQIVISLCRHCPFSKSTTPQHHEYFHLGTIDIKMLLVVRAHLTTTPAPLCSPIPRPLLKKFQHMKRAVKHMQNYVQPSKEMRKH